jgi:hypothetical protein
MPKMNLPNANHGSSTPTLLSPPGQGARANGFFDPAKSRQSFEDGLLVLEVVRGPLANDEDYHTIASEYNRLGKTGISERLMRRWCKDSPCGPALHALVRTNKGRIVGHMCIFPFSMEISGRKVTGGKTEYLFVHEDFRRHTIRGMETSPLPVSFLLLRELYRRAKELGWDPILTSALPGAGGVFQAVGCQPVMFPLFECLLIRRPWNASRFTPNLRLTKRVVCFFLGLIQCSMWATVRLWLLPFGRNIKPQPVAAGFPSGADPNHAHFSSDPDYLAWRYPEEGFQCFGLTNRPDACVIVQKGSPQKFLRVCQTNLRDLEFPVTSLIVGLLEQARSCRTPGVRWAIYEHGCPPTAVVKKLRILGFACVRRQRKVMIYTGRSELADPSHWSFDDSLFTYDFDDSLPT